MASMSMSLCRGIPSETVIRAGSKRRSPAVLNRAFSRCCHGGRSRYSRPISIVSSAVGSRCIARSQFKTPARFFASASQTSNSAKESSKLVKSVTFSDKKSALDGAIQMAFSAVSKKYGQSNNVKKLGIIGLKGSHDHYVNGYFFDFPQVKMIDGRWRVESPLGMKKELGRRRNYQTLGDVFDVEKRSQESEGKAYSVYVKEVLEGLAKEGKRFGAVVLEPVVLGASNMEFVDPLFQYTLVQAIRNNHELLAPSDHTSTSTEPWIGLPIIFDETFTGAYRLGRSDSASLLHVQPDISLHTENSKSGQSIVKSSEEIFAGFDGSSGATSETSLGDSSVLAAVKELDAGGAWNALKEGWLPESKSGATEQINKEGHWSLWSRDFIQQISMSETVRSVMALGTVLVVTLHLKSPGVPNAKSVEEIQRKVVMEDPKEVNFNTKVVDDRTFYVVGDMMLKGDRYKAVQDTITKALTL